MDLENCSFEDVHIVAEHIEGWLNYDEAKLLYNTAKNLTGAGAIVEIGSWCSKSLTYTSAAALSVGNLCKKFSIDPFLTSKEEPNGKYETFISNLKQNGLFDKIIHLKQKSQDAGQNFDEKIELLFIDGFHKYAAVKQDFELFFPKIIEGGFVAIHDITYYEGPTRLVQELAQNSENFKFITFLGATLLGQKVEKLTPEDKLNNQNILQLIELKLKSDNIVLIV